ncbi:hypothetical protein K8R78_01300 [bacterium]|nr:hypothetical protein [bacterium]
MKNTALVLSLFLLPTLLLAAGGYDPLDELSPPQDARGYVFGAALTAVPGNSSYYPGGGGLLATYTTGSRATASYAMPTTAETPMNRQSIGVTYPITGLVRLGTVSLDLRRSDSGLIDGYDEYGTPDGSTWRDSSTALVLGWSIGLGTKVILPDNGGVSLEEEHQAALDTPEGDDTNGDGEIEEYIEEYEEASDWVIEVPEYRPTYYLGLGIKIYSCNLGEAGDQGFGLDLGLAVPLIWETLYLAAGIENLFQPNIQLYDVRSLGQRRIHGGVSFLAGGMTIAAGVIADFHGNLDYSGAVEYGIGEIVALRVGYHGDLSERSEIRTGLGLYLGKLSLDLAAGFLEAGLGQSMQATLGYTF